MVVSISRSGAFGYGSAGGGGPVNLRSPVPGDPPIAEAGEQIERLRAALADRYDVQRLLGEGGMAFVYLAQDLKHGRMVAIKVLRPELGASIGTDRFLREIRTSAQLQHPNILALYDSGEAAGLLFYVMPFVEGESIRDRLNREKQLPIEDAVTLIREAADALDFAHKHGVIHRDIKPENILLQGGHALVADFGIARAVSEAGGEKLTQTGMAIGTPHYMSPEQAMGGDVDARSDVYSLGCVLYELLVGQPPFDGPNAMAILARHSMEAVPAMRIVRKTIPEELESVVDESLEKSPADRFQTAAEFSEALYSVDLTSVRHTTTRATMSRVAIKKKKKRRMMLTGLTAVGILVLAAGAFLVTKLAGGGGGSVKDETFPLSKIAVLYFDASGSGGDSLGHVADGLTEALIKELSQVKGLFVISRNGVRPYRGKDISTDSISRALQVGTLVSGKVSQSGDRLRLDVELVNAATGGTIGSKEIESTRGEIFALQDTLAAEVAGFLRTTLGPDVRLAASRRGTRNARAWELSQQALSAVQDMDAMLEEADTAGARRQYVRADSLFQRAAEEDGKWVTPVTQRARNQYRFCRASTAADKVQKDQCSREALALAEAAVRLDSTDADAREIRGRVLYWRWLLSLEPDANKAANLLAVAEADFQASIAANPLQGSAWSELSHLQASKFQLSDARISARKAYEADPYLTNAHLALWYLFSYAIDQPDPDVVEVTHWCDEGERRFPQDPRFVECRMMIDALPGAKADIPKNWARVKQYVELSPVPLRPARVKRGQMIMSMILGRAGLADSARDVAERARADLSIDPNRELVYLEAMSLGIAGLKDDAFARLTDFAAASPQHAKGLALEKSWMSKELRDDPRWQRLTATVQ